MREGIKETVQELLCSELIGNPQEGEDWNIHFGYDCISIKINKKHSLSIDFLNKLAEEFETELVWIKGDNNGGMMIGCDISTIILRAFGGNWSEYEKAYAIS